MTYIEELQEAIRNRYHAEPTYVETVPVHEEYQGQTVWDGEVEVFDLENASRVYAWAYETDQADEPKRTVNSAARYIAIAGSKSGNRKGLS